jgi:predicted nucleotidyltransferase
MDRSTKSQRERTLVQLLDEKLDAVQASFMDELRYDQRGQNQGLRTRATHWRLGPTEFLLTYHEVAEAPGNAVFRIRLQPSVEGKIPDAWEDIFSMGELDAALRSAKRQRAVTLSDRQGAEGHKKHAGATPEGLILVGLTGSHAYGLNHEGYRNAAGEAFLPSDVDTRGVFVVPTEQVLALEKPAALVEQRETDSTYDEVERFLTLCLKGNPERLEMLAAPKTLVTPEGELLVANQQAFLSKRLIKTYGGYAKQQLYRIERKQERTDKPTMHLIRLMLTGIRILREGRVDPDMRAYRDRLLAIRFGEVPLEEAFRWHHELEVEFARAAEETRLPEEPDAATANRILLEIRRAHLAW